VAENSSAFLWRKSRFCGTSSCVEVAFSADAVLIRDSKEQESAAAFLRFDMHAWQAFVDDLRSGSALVRPTG